MISTASSSERSGRAWAEGCGVVYADTYALTHFIVAEAFTEGIRPRKGKGGSTRQGMYIFTPSGKLLTYRNHHEPEVMRGELRY